MGQEGVRGSDNDPFYASWGEYNMEDNRTPAQLAELRTRNDEFYRRIENMSSELETLRTGLEENHRMMSRLEGYLVGPDGENGLRSELRRFMKFAEKRQTTIENAMKMLEDKVDADRLELERRLAEQPKQLAKSVGSVIVALGTLGGLVTALIRTVFHIGGGSS